MSARGRKKHAKLTAGRQYIPFGYCDSHFVTDPATLVLGETNNGAAVAGYRFGGEMVDVSVGAFNDRVDKAGDDNTINSFVGAVVVSPLAGIMVGAAYTSNIAASDALSEFVVDTDRDGDVNDLADIVGGWSAFATVEFLERFKVFGEYAGALDEFEAGAIHDPTDAKKRRPATWNVELGVGIIEAVEAAVRCGGSTDGATPLAAGDFYFLPESEYGAIINWGMFENTNLAVEYLRAQFKDNAEIKTDDTVTVQLAVEF